MKDLQVGDTVKCAFEYEKWYTAKNPTMACYGTSKKPWRVRVIHEQGKSVTLEQHGAIRPFVPRMYVKLWNKQAD
jgi:hypothetical protein